MEGARVATKLLYRATLTVPITIFSPAVARGLDDVSNDR